MLDLDAGAGSPLVGSESLATALATLLVVVILAHLVPYRATAPKSSTSYTRNMVYTVPV